MPPPADDDARYMARCLELAAQFAGFTSPNPIVGCVIVRDGQVLAEGAHERAGTAHAEIVALGKLADARGATLYVNLEPCNHHGRTPPCAPAIVRAGLARVVVGATDPIPGHGGGIGVLRAAGIDVTEGVLRAACERANLGFYAMARHGRPGVTLKAAVSLDGKIARAAGPRLMLTGPEASADVHLQRRAHDAILVGVETILADDPQLTCRLAGGRDPVRVILDTHLRTPPTARALPALICTAVDAPDTIRCATTADGRLDLADVLAKLAARGIQSVLVEGGARVHASFLRVQLVDQVLLYVAPLLAGPGPAWSGDAEAKLALVEETRLGADVKLTLDFLCDTERASRSSGT
ncbi:MAG TPA: bifunctional diaminohydroxyphosphoribosylaminopyrimidine deaminase/5-amino-6-(5-phosphoribosylamino)uracil reductase RibD [Kofleriaceae bacterium]|jgi:diaminohydroxyphosphoribosylaminopyrimidine deaminase/5-amino-6-(5-phosphoribosylamino)uracil reductase